MMDKEEFRAALRKNNLTPDEFAAMIGRSLAHVYDFGARYPVPYYARSHLELIELTGGPKSPVVRRIKGEITGNP